MEKIIQITCVGAESIPIESLSLFQGNLKTLSEPQFKKLKASIIKHGFSFPVFIWKSKKNNYIIDGHQRLFVLQKMIEEGWHIKDNRVPVVWIEAKDQKQAKEKILLAASQFGKIDIEGLYEFVEIEGLDFQELKEIVDIPNINLDYIFGPPEKKLKKERDKDNDLNSEEDLLTNYLIVYFDTVEDFVAVKELIGLKGLRRSISFNQLEEAIRKKGA